MRDHSDLAAGNRGLDPPPEPFHTALEVDDAFAKARRRGPKIALPGVGGRGILPPEIAEDATLPGAEVDLTQFRRRIDGQAVPRCNDRGRGHCALEIARPDASQRSLSELIGEA